MGHPLNGCRKFVNEHDEAGDDNNHHDKNNTFCWNCQIMNNLITMMTHSQNSTIIDFNNYLFEVPPPVQDSKKPNQLINHPFSIFQKNMQNDAYACNQRFELMEKIQPEISDIFTITIMSHITCNQCNAVIDSNFLNEYSLSLSISDRNILTISEYNKYFLRMKN